MFLCSPLVSLFASLRSNYTQINNNESINDREIVFPPKMLQIPPKMLALFSNANACLLFSKKCRHNLERPIHGPGNTYIVQFGKQTWVTVGHTSLVGVTFHVQFIHHNVDVTQSLCSWGDIFSRRVLSKLAQVATIIIAYELY